MNVLRVCGHHFSNRRTEFLADLCIRNICVTIRNPRHRAQHISVNRRNRDRKCCRCNCACRIFPDSRQFQKLFIGRREVSLQFMGNNFCRFLQIPRPAIISKPLPAFHERFFRCICQCVYRRKFLQKSGIVPQYRRHAGLLQHNFRNTDTIWVFRLPPR